jgi:aspartate aminotransferase
MNTMTLSSRLDALRPTAVNSILSEVRALQATGETVVSLMRGEPDFRTPPHIAEAAARALTDGRTSYADNRGELRLREAVVAKLSRDNAVAYDAGSEILVTTGATFGIYAALTALLNEGSEVLVPDPVYDAYQSPILLAGGRIRRVRATIVNGRFTLSPEAIAEAVTPASRVLLLNTPWNPVGTVFSREELASIGEMVVRHDLTLLSDEIYEAIVYDGHRHISPASLAPEVRKRCVVVNSLSKTYAMTGWRVGYCAAPPDVINAMFLVLQQSSRGPSTFVQDAAAAALAGDQTCVEQMRVEYASRREQVSAALGGLPHARPLRAEGGFFTMVDARESGVPSNDIRRRLLHDHRVVVAHGSAYGAGGEGTLRVSFATGGKTLAEGLQRLRAGLATL